MSRTSNTPSNNGPQLNCCNSVCNKTLAKPDGIKCSRCKTITPLNIHFYPGNALSGGSALTDWEHHFQTSMMNGCETCGIKNGSDLSSPSAIAAIHFYPAYSHYSKGIIKTIWDKHLLAAQTEGCEICGITALTPPEPSGSHDLAAFFVKKPANLDTKGMDYKLPIFSQADPNWLSGARILIISADGPELPELYVPMQYLRERGAQVMLAGQDWIFEYREPAGHIVVSEWLSDELCIKADLRLSDVRLEDFDAVFIPGGAWNPDMLRTDDKALRIVREAHRLGLLIVSLCHGPQVVCSAAFDAPEGQQNFPSSNIHITGTSSIRRDLRNAGFIVHDTDATVYDEGANLLTARDPNDLGPLCEQFGKLLNQRLISG